MTARWFAGRRVYDQAHRPRHYVARITGQPRDGFETVGEVMDWLAAQGLIVYQYVPEEGHYWTGWGDPFCAVGGSRDDPWDTP